MADVGYCLAPGSKVLLADGSRRAVESLRKGDEVWTRGGSARILALVECRRESYHRMYTINGVTLSPEYPFRRGEQWARPMDMPFYTETLMPTVYAVILELSYTIDVGGFECVTLGHGLTGGIVEHRYLGSQRVIEDVRNQPGWESGRPVYQNLIVIHNRVTGAVDRWVDVPG
jgi:hypothetical protein